MTYYFMTEEQTNEYYEIYHARRVEKLGEIAREHVISQLGHNPFDKGSLSAHEKHVIKREYAIANASLTEYLSHVASPMAKLKADIIAEACRYFDSIGVTEGYIKTISLLDLTTMWETQSWTVFKTEEGWYYQNRSSKKTVHKVEVE